MTDFSLHSNSLLLSGLRVEFVLSDLSIRIRAIPITKQTIPITATVEANTSIFRDICLSFRSAGSPECSKSSGKWLPRRNCNSWFIEPISKECAALSKSAWSCWEIVAKIYRLKELQFYSAPSASPWSFNNCLLKWHRPGSRRYLTNRPLSSVSNNCVQRQLTELLSILRPAKQMKRLLKGLPYSSNKSLPTRQLT